VFKFRSHLHHTSKRPKDLCYQVLASSHYIVHKLNEMCEPWVFLSFSVLHVLPAVEQKKLFHRLAMTLRTARFHRRELARIKGHHFNDFFIIRIIVVRYPGFQWGNIIGDFPPIEPKWNGGLHHIRSKMNPITHCNINDNTNMLSIEINDGRIRE